MPSELNNTIKSGNPYADKLHEKIVQGGIDFATGLPCGELKYFIHNLTYDNKIMHRPALHEPEAIAIAAGAWLAGKSPIVYMQNSGMFKASNEIGSIILASKIPLLMLVAYRGCKGEDATQHMATGKSTKPLLKSMGIPYAELTENNIEEIADTSFYNMAHYSIPSAVLVRKNWSSFEPGKEAKSEECNSIESRVEDAGTFNKAREACERIIDMRGKHCDLGREQALDTIINNSSQDTALFSTTGLISRSCYDRHDSPNQFYNAGGFGHTSTLAYGFATAKPDVKAIAIDGDGSLLTNWGTLLTIGSSGQKNLVHVVIDNGTYASCSGENTLSKKASIPLSAAIQGYNVIRVNNSKGLNEAMKQALSLPYLTMIHAEVALGGRRDFKRPLDMPGTARRFREHFNNGRI